ncbi:hypothetical protein [Pseudomonas nitroreducens]|uniref:Tail terminator n=1 Tax=Pseudomonas nitroreducens TaxID=46680 RepID=A0A2D0ADV4_PSENT|nr:hypothetical protein [Pseudomonas nitroreducens]OWP50268.1 hypothetical protein CEG18_11990 [Pseudomonas nitroreducens]
MTVTVHATSITDELVARLQGITLAAGYPLEIRTTLRGKSMEDCQDEVPLPVVSVLPAASSQARSENGQPTALGRRERQLVLELVLDFADYPDRERDEVFDQAEWSITKALGGFVQGRALGARVFSMSVEDVEFDYPTPAHTLGAMRLTVAVGYVERY